MVDAALPPQLLVWVVVCDWVALGAAGAPPEGFVAVAEVVDGTWAAADVVVVVGGPVDDVVDGDDELVVAVSADV